MAVTYRRMDSDVTAAAWAGFGDPAPVMELFGEGWRWRTMAAVPPSPGGEILVVEGNGQSILVNPTDWVVRMAGGAIQVVGANVFQATYGAVDAPPEPG